MTKPTIRAARGVLDKWLHHPTIEVRLIYDPAVPKEDVDTQEAVLLHQIEMQLSTTLEYIDE